MHRGGLLLAVLVLPLSIPVLIFGVAASQAAISGPLSFGTPFSILCALSLVSFVIGPFAAAASLRHGLDLIPTLDQFDPDQLSRSRNETNQTALPAPPLTTIRMP